MSGDWAFVALVGVIAICVTAVRVARVITNNWDDSPPTYCDHETLEPFGKEGAVTCPECDRVWRVTQK